MKSSKLVIRTVSGTLLVLIVVGSLLAGPLLFALFTLLLILVMSSEFLRIATKGEYPLLTKATLTTSTLLYTLSLLWAKGSIGAERLWLLIPILLLTPLTFLFIKAKEKCHSEEGELSILYFFMAPLYIALPLSLTPLLLFDKLGVYTPNLMISLFILLWSADGGGYLFGMAFGQRGGHKLCPSISPKKSWEGFGGGALLTLLSSIILVKLNLLPIPLTDAIIMGQLLFLFSVAGDLTESIFKRKFGIKDSGSIMPGHGGMLDRFDGALFAFPIAIAYLKFFLSL